MGIKVFMSLLTKNAVQTKSIEFSKHISVFILFFVKDLRLSQLFESKYWRHVFISPYIIQQDNVFNNYLCLSDTIFNIIIFSLFKLLTLKLKNFFF